MASRTSSILSLAFCAALVTACSSKPKTGAPMQSPAAVDPAIVSAFDLASSDAFVTLVLQPVRWVAFIIGVRPMISQWGEVTPESLTQALTAPSPYALMEPLFGGGLEGLDRERPIAAGLFVSTGPELAPVAALVGPTDGGLEGLRHRIIVPASDAAALVGSIATLMERAEATAVTSDSNLDATTLYAAIAEGDHVRVELVVGDRPAADRAAWRAHWKTLLTAVPTPRPSKSAARHHATSTTDIATAYLDLTRLRRSHITIGVNTVDQALRFADPDMRQELLAAGTAEVLGAWDLLAPEDLMSPELALSLGVLESGGLTLRVVGALSAEGKAAHEAARADAGPFFQSKEDPNAIATMTLHTSYRALIDAVKVPASLVSATQDDIAETIMRCGWACSIGAGSPGVSKRLFEIASPSGGLGILPRSAAIVVTPAPPIAKRAPPLAFALAAGYREGDLDSSVLTRLLASLPPGMFTSKTDSVGDRQAVYLGMGRDASEALPVGDPGPIVSLSVNVGALAEAMRPPRSLRKILPLLGRLEGKVVLAGSALVGGFTLAPKGASPATFDLTDYTDLPVVATPASTDGTRCLGDAVTALAKGWHAMSEVSPDQRQLVRMKATVGAKVPLACAIGDAGVGELGRMLAEIDTRLPVPAPKPVEPRPEPQLIPTPEAPLVPTPPEERKP
ncbi:MAG: hypothetical protein JNJ59_08580 [Deltaproteobacteria bacterium]|nr:hypothetical protein [Deltaproteobacteria bacterium]